MIATLYKQAVGLARAGRKDEAREMLQQVLELNPLNRVRLVMVRRHFPND